MFFLLSSLKIQIHHPCMLFAFYLLSLHRITCKAYQKSGVTGFDSR